MRDRREEIVQMVREICRERIPESKEKIRKCYDDNHSRVLHDILPAFEHVLSRAGKKKVKYMVIAFLYSGVMTGSRNYKVILYDDSFYLDLCAVSEMVCFEFLNPFLDEDIRCVTGQISKNHVRMTETERDVIKIECSIQYMGILEDCLQNILSQLLQTGFFDHMCKDDDFKVILGEYMGRGKVIYGSKTASA